MQVNNIKYVHVWFVWKTFNVQSQLFLALFAKFLAVFQFDVKQTEFQNNQKKFYIKNCYSELFVNALRTVH